MALTETDIAFVAKLARLHVTPDQQPALKHELNQVMGLIEQLQSIDTKGIEPLAHPLSVLHDIELRLREDERLATNTIAQRDHLMQNAPATADGLFLVPRVIE
jgi:aspartyl-tRNA(Asn)/glutamyl-tRNA(Gln) amidotransferase subunit C|uniref:Asp-tRNA(Asn)/Glu-tRNA(Gln) amidotransferase subunit GatC n=1 Tax=Orrella sp. TaxID=1921583 RepID=UPI00404822EB